MGVSYSPSPGGGCSGRRWVALGLTATLTAAALGCGDDGGGDGSGGDGSGGAGAGMNASTGATPGAGGDGGGVPIVEELTPNAPPLPGHDACSVTITTRIPVASAQHEEPCTEIAYATNPPSGGDHWSVWAAFGTYDAPVPREMVVHDLEHGAISLSYDCAGCDAEVREALIEATIQHGGDERCLAHGTIARFVVAPDPALDHPVALAAWGATYVATCIDPPSIAAFLEAHYGNGPEDTCFPGTDPASLECR